MAAAALWYHCTSQEKGKSFPASQSLRIASWLHPAHSAEQCSADVPRNFIRTVVLCVAGLMLAAVMLGYRSQALLCAALHEAVLPHHTIPLELLLEIWLPKLLQSAPQPAVATAHGSPSIFKIRSLSDVPSTTFDLYTSKAEREWCVYPLEQDSWK